MINFSPCSVSVTRKFLLDQLQDPVVLHEGLFAGCLEHLKAREDEEGAEHEEDPREGHDQSSAQANQDGAEHDDTKDAQNSTRCW
jgi:hypothetical protein